jgi:hypothetical protein
LGDLGEWLDTQIFKSGSFTATLTGYATPPTGTVDYDVSCNLVVLRFPSISGTSNSTSLAMTGLPSILYPVQQHTALIRVTDDGTTMVGLISINANGTVTFNSSAAAGTFTNTGTKGIAQTTITYSLG